MNEEQISRNVYQTVVFISGSLTCTVAFPLMSESEVSALVEEHKQISVEFAHCAIGKLAALRIKQTQHLARCMDAAQREHEVNPVIPGMSFRETFERLLVVMDICQKILNICAVVGITEDQVQAVIQADTKALQEIAAKHGLGDDVDLKVNVPGGNA